MVIQLYHQIQSKARGWGKMRQTGTNVSPMSNAGRNHYVVTQLTAALLALMQEKPFPDISITELIGRAEVGRASFYRNFASKEDVLVQHMEAITVEFQQNQRFSYAPERFQEYTVMLFDHLERNRDFALLLYQNGLLHLAEGVFEKFFLLGAADRAGQYRQMYLAGGFFHIFKFWLMTGCRESPRELEDMFLAFV